MDKNPRTIEEIIEKAIEALHNTKMDEEHVRIVIRWAAEKGYRLGALDRAEDEFWNPE